MYLMALLLYGQATNFLNSSSTSPVDVQHMEVNFLE